MVESFRGLGVEAVPGVGAPFDPELHEAIMREENDEVPDGTVLREFRRGFRLGGKLLRAAMVQARGPRPAPALRPRRGRPDGGLRALVGDARRSHGPKPLCAGGSGRAGAASGGGDGVVGQGGGGVAASTAASGRRVPGLAASTHAARVAARELHPRMTELVGMHGQPSTPRGARACGEWARRPCCACMHAAELPA
jgi:hypothetical protein